MRCTDTVWIGCEPSNQGSRIDCRANAIPPDHSQVDQALEALWAMELSHGQTLWVLSDLGFSAGATAGTFNYYIKSLRKLGIPFRRGEYGLRGGRLAKYSFNHLMELSVALSMRIYAIIPDIVLGGLIRFREELYNAYRTAYVESDVGIGATIFVSAEGSSGPGFRMNGVYLDLQLTYSAGQLASIGPPRILTPREALAWFATTAPPARAHPPLNLSQMALSLAEVMKRAPSIRRGPKPQPADKHGEDLTIRRPSRSVPRKSSSPAS
jgi:hypothetical protein